MKLTEYAIRTIVMGFIAMLKRLEMHLLWRLKKHRPRSIAQNSYLHVCLAYFASEFGYNLEEVKYNIFKKIVNKDIFSKQRVSKRGQMVTYWRSTADLDTKELTDAIERFRNYSAMVAGLYIPEPNEEDALLEAQKQIALYEKYL